MSILGSRVSEATPGNAARKIPLESLGPVLVSSRAGSPESLPVDARQQERDVGSDSRQVAEGAAIERDRPPLAVVVAHGLRRDVPSNWAAQPQTQFFLPSLVTTSESAWQAASASA